MGLPSQPVTLTPEQLEALNSQLATMRHDINNYLSLLVAASELIRFKPQAAEKMLGTMGEQPKKISAAMNKFTAEFEKTLGITR
jgi:Cu/Ag efflux protein CusF